MATITPTKLPTNIMRKLSIASGLLSFLAFVIAQLGETWGFEGVGQQIAQTMLIVNGGLALFFGGSTTQKNIEDKKEAEDGKKE